MKKKLISLILFHLFVISPPVYGQGVIQDGLYLTYQGGGPLVLLETCRDLKRDGVVFEYYTDGSVKKLIHYKNDLPHGMAQLYAEDGTLRKLIDYQNGKIVSVKTYDKDGHLIEL